MHLTHAAALETWCATSTAGKGDGAPAALTAERPGYTPPATA